MNDANVKNDFDSLLHSYFKSKMPSPWPAWQTPESRALPRRKSWLLTYGRLAIAASVGMLLAAYLALAGFFPREVSGRLNQDPSRHIGHKAGPGAAQPK